MESKIRIKSLTPRVGKYNINNIVFSFDEDNIAEIENTEENEFSISELIMAHSDIILLSLEENDKKNEEEEKDKQYWAEIVKQLEDKLSKEVEKNATLLQEKLALEAQLNLLNASSFKEGEQSKDIKESIEKEAEVTSELVVELQKLTIPQIKESILVTDTVKYPEEEWKVIKNKTDLITYIVNKQ